MSEGDGERCYGEGCEARSGEGSEGRDKLRVGKFKCGGGDEF